MLQREALISVLQWLERRHLDAVQITCRILDYAVSANVSQLPLRPVRVKTKEKKFTFRWNQGNYAVATEGILKV